MAAPGRPATAQGLAQYVSFDDFRQGLPLGRFHVVVNPDLARRFRENLPLNAPFKDAPLYGGDGPHGYTDYPSAG